MSNRDPRLCAKAVQGFWNNERELIKQGQGTRDWSIQEQIEIMNFKPSGGERQNAAAPSYGQGYATDYGMSYDKYEGQHMKSAEAHPEYQGNSGNIQALTREEHQQAHGGDFRNATNGYYNPEMGQTTDFGDNPPISPQHIELSEAYADTDEYQYIINSADSQSDDALSAYEQRRGETQDNYESVLNDYEHRKEEAQNADSQQSYEQAQTNSGGESGSIYM